VTGVPFPFSIATFPLLVLTVFFLRAIYAGPGYVYFVLLFPPFTLWSLIETASFLVTHRILAFRPARARVKTPHGERLAIPPGAWNDTMIPSSSDLLENTKYRDFNLFGAAMALHRSAM